MTATDVADWLVTKANIPFRDAHHITGQIVALAVRPPNGSVSINALPWAEVWIDGTSVGQTPLGNLSVPLGEHEVVFRHPELGERREKAFVRSDRLTRVSANFER